MNEALFMMIQTQASFSTGYWLGGAIAILLMAYLVYSLIKPEKF